MYPTIEPFFTDWIEVSPQHSLYVERSGNKGGYPIFFVHGGPGSQTNPCHRQYFDPSFFDIVLFDQRGCGKSRPLGEVSDNDTWALVEDINVIRDTLGISKKICLFGGSWGSSLSLAYASTYPEAIEEMVLRGIFLGTHEELHWFTEGLARFATTAWEEFASSGAENLVDYYYEKVNSPDRNSALQAARLWSRYEIQTMRIGSADHAQNRNIPLPPEEQLLARVRVQLHYLKNQCFFRENQLLESATGINVPVTIIQGGVDFICPPITAHRLSEQLPQARLRIVGNAGHDALSEELAEVLTEETNSLRDRLRNKDESAV